MGPRGPLSIASGSRELSILGAQAVRESFHVLICLSSDHNWWPHFFRASHPSPQISLCLHDITLKGMFRPVSLANRRIVRTTDSCRPHRSRVKRGGRPKVWGTRWFARVQTSPSRIPNQTFFLSLCFLAFGLHVATLGVEVPSCGQAPPCPDTRGGVTKVEDSTAPY